MKEDIRLVVNPSVPEELRSAMERVVREGMGPEAELIYDGGRNRLWVEKVKPEPSGSQGVVTEMNVKAFGLPKFPNSLIYGVFRKSKAQRSYEHAMRLLQLGFDTPQPMGYAEVRVAGSALLRRSFYFSAQLPWPNMRFWESDKDYDHLRDAWGAEIARLHQAGVWMKDHSAGNILRHRDDDGHWHFAYVDLNRMAFGVTDEHRLMKMFKSVSTALEFTVALARSYALAAGKDPDKAASMAEKIYRRFNRRKH